MASTSIHISIIIVSWNTKELLRTCLSTLLRQEGVVSEIYVVDNNSLDSTQEMIRNEFPNVKTIFNTTNRGFASANNQALRLAKGDYVVLINPDIEFTSNETLARVIGSQNEHKAGIASPQLLNSDGTIQRSVRHNPTFLSQALILLKLHLFFPRLAIFKKYFQQNFNYSQSSEIQQLMGAFFSISKQCKDMVGLLDEQFFIWFEEVDYCTRAKEAGFTLWYESSVSVIHHGGQSFQQIIPLNRQKMFNKSLFLYAKKHFTLIQWLLLYCLNPISLLLARLTPKAKKPHSYKSK